MVQVLVTGGGGFLGSAVIRLLVKRGLAVRSFNRSFSPDLATMGVEAMRGDLADPVAVDAAVAGCETVFHVAAKAGVWGAYRAYYDANVRGTEHVLEACRKHGVRQLIYTSSPSVVHSGGDIEGGDESLPYPESFEAPYPETKAMAEQMVLAANSVELSTVSLRPHLIWGPEDNHLVPRIVDRGRSGRLRLVGHGRAKVDSVFIDNAAQAHLDAFDRLVPGASCAGRAYFITNGEPMAMADLINGILAAAGVKPVSRRIPLGVAVAVGKLLETTHRLVAPSREPLMTAFLARQLATAHWFDISAARRDLGYEPTITIAAGLIRLKAWFANRDVPP